MAHTAPKPRPVGRPRPPLTERRSIVNAKKHDPRPKLLPDEGATVDEHGRPPGVPSRTGPGAGPPADPARVERAGKEGTHRKTGAELPADSGGERAE